MAHCGPGWIVIAAVSLGCGGSSKPPPVTPPTAPAAVAPAPPGCSPPRQVAVVQRADDPAATRLLLVDVASRKVVWTGPPASGEVGGRWSGDGRLLAYAVAEDLIVHDGIHPDRLVFRGLSAEDPRFAFSGDGRWLAAVSADGLVAIDVAGSDNLQRKAVDTGVDCAVDFLGWSPAGQLAVSCEDDGRLHRWEPATGERATIDVDDLGRILGWMPDPAGALIAVRGDGELWSVPLGGAEPTLLRGSFGDSGIVPSVAAGSSGRIALSDYDEDEGYPRTVWLSRPAPEPPLAWLDGMIADLAFTPDGSWATFVSAIDTVDDGGDLYLVRVGDRKVVRLLATPRYQLEEPLSDDHYEDDGEGDEEAEVYYLGYAAPAPRPDPEARCALRPGPASQRLEIVDRLSTDDGQRMARPGGLIVEDGEMALTLRVAGGTRFEVDAGLPWESFRRLPGGAVVGGAAGQTIWWSPTGAEVARLAVADPIAGLAGLDGGGLAYVTPSGEVVLADADGGTRGRHAPASPVDRLFRRGDGVAALLADDSIVNIGADGAVVGRFGTDARDAMAGLAGGAVVHVELPPADDEEEEAEVTDGEPVELVVHSARGEQRGLHRVSAVGGTVSALVALPGGGAVAIVGEERTRAIFIDDRGAAVGELPLGQPPESPVAVLADGTSVIAGFGGRDLYLVDPRGRYLGGLTLADEIMAGPYAAAGDRIVVETEGEILVLARRSR